MNSAACLVPTFCIGGAGNDVLQGDVHISHPDQGGGDDTLIGGDGTDTAQFRGHLSDYEITENADGTITVTDTVAGRDGTDVLSSIETLQFADGSHPVCIGFCDTRRACGRSRCLGWARSRLSCK